MTDSTLYSVLGVTPDSSIKEIRAAYHRIALQHHPDRGSTADVAQFRLALDAHSILSDPHKRLAYDRELRLDKVRTARQRSSTQFSFTSSTSSPAGATYSSTTTYTYGGGTAGTEANSAANSAASSAWKYTDSVPADTEASRRRRRPEQTRFEAEHTSPSPSPQPVPQPAQEASSVPQSASHVDNRQNWKRHSSPRQQQPQVKRHFGEKQSWKTNMKEAFHADQVVDLTNSTDSDRGSSMSQDENPLPQTRTSLSTSESEIEVDASRQTESAKAYSNTPQSSGSSGSSIIEEAQYSYEAPQANESHERGKRKHAKGGESMETPPAKKTRFDMSDFGSVPPFTQTHGNFNLEGVSEAVPKGATPPPRQYNRRVPRASQTPKIFGQASNDSAPAAAAANAAAFSQVRTIWGSFTSASQNHSRELDQAQHIAPTLQNVPSILENLQLMEAQLQQWLKHTQECCQLLLPYADLSVNRK